MFVKVVRKSTLMTGTLLCCAAAAWLLLAWPQAAASGISRGLSICSTIIIPSLFPFLVLAGFLVRSGLSQAMGRRLESVTQWLFGLPGCCAPAILIGFIGGYPSGSVAVGELVRQGLITPAQGRRLLCFCVNGGPAFIISAVGVGMMGSVTYGMILYAAHILAAIVIGVMLRFSGDNRQGETESAPPVVPGGRMTAKPSQKAAPTAAFVESVSAACRTLILMCGFILLFASLLSLADASGFSRGVQSAAERLINRLSPSDYAAPAAASLLPCLLEVSCGCVEAARTGAVAPLLLGVCLGWGGLSVHGQIAASLQDLRLIGRRFFAMRLLHGFLGGAFGLMLFRIIPVPVSVYSPLPSDVVVAPYSTSVAASVSLLFLCALFLLSTATQNDSPSPKSSASNPFSTNSAIPTGKREADMV